MDSIAVYILFPIGLLIGMIIGQLSVWRYLRKKGTVRVDVWEYSARQIKELYLRSPRDKTPI